ncbi:hypothetical protein [Vibrio rumoiensis]|uniref:Uncharacterized protein n=1 Tax=Vibrio rumoiensis 1S-45 TaxID=1188252 RepID=A0A1E5DYR6_9VIBR|nr:hypothetical protein [Vibrio rumoiensis]OEF22662.1 hypothetical protein A1QC_03120 [Vibrio rumoiensis 1S-45]
MIGLILLLFVIGSVIFIHQVLSSFCSTKIFSNKISKALFYLSALFGTPIHELSHAFVAVIFGHKIQAIKFFQAGADGRLGYVKHQWNTRSVYQSVGVFFIALAPLFTAFLFIHLLLNNLAFPIQSFVLQIDVATLQTISFAVLDYFWNTSTQIVRYSLNSLENTMWLVLISLLCFHCIPSRTDFGNALKGSVIVILLLSILWGVSYLFNLHHQQWMLAMFNWSVNMSSLIAIVSLLSMFWWLILTLPSIAFRA